MRKFLFLFFGLLAFSVVHSQEICNNGIDDDADGLVDLNDPDCSCGSTSIPSLIPNPSFETMNCCPSTYSQMNCAGSWVQASSATSDYMNTCGIVFGAATAAGLVPFPDGNGIVGCIFMPGWQEYVGTCLSSPLIAGTQYTINMNIASTPIGGQGEVCNNGVIDYGPIDVVLYGATSCASLPFNGTACPPAPWQVLGQVNYTPNPAWGVITISFTPSVNIAAVIIGSPCTLPASYTTPSGCYPYFYFDNLLLNTTASFSAITPAGSMCANNFQLLSSLTAGATYQWYLNGVALAGQTNPTLDISLNAFGPGNYSCVVTDGPNCSTSSYLVAAASPPTATFTNTTACFGSSPTQFTDGSTSTGTITGWSWNFGDPPSGGNNTSTLQNPTHLFSSTGTFNVTLVSTSNNGCSDTVVIPVTVNPAPVADAGINQSICSGGPATLTATGGGTYVWNGGTLVNAGGASQTVSPFNTTSYVVTVTNGFGCTDNDTMTVTVNQPPVFTAGPDVTVCNGDTAQLNASGTGTFVWSPATGLSNANISNPLAFPATTTTYTTTLTDANGCSATDNITVTVGVSPVAVASNDTAVCGGVNVNLTASGGTTYLWNGGTLVNAVGANQTVAPTVTTTYIVTVISANGCTDTEPVTVTVNSPTATAGQDATICLGQSTILTASGGISYSWSPATGLNNPNISNPTASPTVTTTYTVTATNSIGCTATDVVTVTVSPTPISAFTYLPAVILADSTYYFTDQSTGGVSSWLWNFGDGNTSTTQNPSHFYIYAGTYHVCLITTSNAGCMDTTCWDVEVLPRDLQAPNVFTPNGDGTNDFLVFNNLNYFPNSAILIYDRWGALVYENGNYLNDWNGKKNGNGADCVDGTYYYILSGPSIKETMTGFVQLIRGK